MSSIIQNISYIPDKIDCNESDKMEETYLDSKGKNSLIIDVEVKDNIFQDTRFDSIGIFVEKIITKTNETELLSEKEITTILLPRGKIFILSCRANLP